MLRCRPTGSFVPARGRRLARSCGEGDPIDRPPMPRLKEFLKHVS
ncbi:hypothetical protein BURMUCGD2_5148 [Burkholderia multivorans CGD2]|uniref:Uncharacterized protein n=1 Tax=Burkholderia multivorans CGD2 TaxID=513052 RepID=B9BJ92_9BURK|nr:hypothetical protein BURMUCGD2_5148 [Burkholderia multivorans CGD2]